MLKKIMLHEFLRIVCSKTFIVSLVLVPLIALLPFAHFGITTYELNEQKKELLKDKEIVVVDKIGWLKKENNKKTRNKVEQKIKYQVKYWLSSNNEIDEKENKPEVANIFVTKINSIKEGQKLLKENKCKEFFVIGDKYLKDKTIKIFTNQNKVAGLRFNTYADLEEFFNLRDAEFMGVKKDAYERINTPPKFDIYDMSKNSGNASGKSSLINKSTLELQLVVPIFLIFVFFVAICMSYDGIISSVTREKKTKLVEILLSSVSAEELLLGKVMGVLGASIIKMIAWGGIFIIIPFLAMPFYEDLIEYNLPFLNILLIVLFSACGILLYGTLCAGTAFLIDSEQGAKFPMIILMTISCVPLAFILKMIEEPNGIYSIIFSYLPIFSPIGMPIKLAIQSSTSWHEIVSSLILLIGTIYLSIKFSSRLFRVALARQGEKTGIKGFIKAFLQYK